MLSKHSLCRPRRPISSLCSIHNKTTTNRHKYFLYVQLNIDWLNFALFENSNVISYYSRPSYICTHQYTNYSHCLTNGIIKYQIKSVTYNTVTLASTRYNVSFYFFIFIVFVNGDSLTLQTQCAFYDSKIISTIFNSTRVVSYCTSITYMLIIACRLYSARFLSIGLQCTRKYTRARITTTCLPPGWKQTVRVGGTIRVLTYIPCFAAPAIAVWRWRLAILLLVLLYFWLRLYICIYIDNRAVRSSVGVYCAAEHQEFYMRHELRYVSWANSPANVDSAQHSVCIFACMFGCGGFSDTLVHRAHQLTTTNVIIYNEIHLNSSSSIANI